jgi:phosphopantothenoylcysteine decarboxylase/phosphopantothenate--cysteine ligase
MAEADGPAGRPLAGSRILLIIGGGIAAYKALDLIRRLRERQTLVRVIMTAAARHFVTPLAASALSGDAVHEDLFSLTAESEMGHIELSRDADLLVVAPATANLIARMAAGLADDLATTALLATDKKILIAPAMNLRMWLHPATRRNVERLRGDGVLVVGPNDGDMACGEFGPGRMAEPLEIVDAIVAALSGPTALPLPAGPLSGLHVLVTSGPTFEPIDPVRFIGNRSSGKQGHAIARAASQAGARVTLISGPVALADPSGVGVTHVETARDMLAAVADWRVEPGVQKTKKSAAGPPTLDLIENPDILASVARRDRGRPRLVVGFAAETENVIANARAKLESKRCDLIVANNVEPASGVFGGSKNSVHLIGKEGVESWPVLDKTEIATRLVALLSRIVG